MAEIINDGVVICTWQVGQCGQQDCVTAVKLRHLLWVLGLQRRIPPFKKHLLLALRDQSASGHSVLEELSTWAVEPFQVEPDLAISR